MKPTRKAISLFVDPGGGVRLPVGELLGLEPEGDLLGGGLNTIGSVADVAANIDAEISADGSGEGVGGVGGAEEGAASLDGALALPDHGADGAGAEVLAEALVEALLGEIGVVLLGLLEGGDEDLQADELVALLLEAADDITDETALDSVGLDSDESALHYLVYAILQ